MRRQSWFALKSRLSNGFDYRGRRLCRRRFACDSGDDVTRDSGSGHQRRCASACFVRADLVAARWSLALGYQSGMLSGVRGKALRSSR